MGKLDDAVESLTAEMKKLGLKPDVTLLTAVAKGLGSLCLFERCVHSVARINQLADRRDDARELGRRQNL